MYLSFGCFRRFYRSFAMRQRYIETILLSRTGSGVRRWSARGGVTGRVRCGRHASAPPPNTRTLCSGFGAWAARTLLMAFGGVERHRQSATAAAAAAAPPRRHADAAAD